jgi:hypothetical protein
MRAVGSKHGGETSGTAGDSTGFSRMGPGIFLIAILGCGDSDAPCRQVKLLDTPYQSRVECMAASEEALAKNADAPYPTIVAQCLAASRAASFRLGADEVLKPAAPATPFLPPRRIVLRN